MDVELPDGTVIQGVPDGTTRAQLVQKLKANGYDVSKLEEKPSGVVQVAKDLAAGAVRGAGSIGATLMAPFDYAEQGIERLMGAPARPVSINQQRRQAAARPQNTPAPRSAAPPSPPVPAA